MNKSQFYILMAIMIFFIFIIMLCYMDYGYPFTIAIILSLIIIIYAWEEGIPFKLALIPIGLIWLFYLSYICGFWATEPNSPEIPWIW